jgi:hypothetical protein
MAKLDLDLDDLTPTALKRLVKQLLIADEAGEQKLMKSLYSKVGSHNKKEEAAEPNDLADLHEEMHGSPKTPEVCDDDMPCDGSLPDVKHSFRNANKKK